LCVERWDWIQKGLGTEYKRDYWRKWNLGSLNEVTWSKLYIMRSIIFPGSTEEGQGEGGDSGCLKYRLLVCVCTLVVDCCWHWIMNVFIIQTISFVKIYKDSDSRMFNKLVMKRLINSWNTVVALLTLNFWVLSLLSTGYLFLLVMTRKQW